jgi:hypothetical protein
MDLTNPSTSPHYWIFAKTRSSMANPLKPPYRSATSTAPSVPSWVTKSPKNTGTDSLKIPSISTSKVVPDKASAHLSPRESPSNSKAMPTTTSAKDSAAVKSSSTPPPNPHSSLPKTSSSATLLSTEPPAVKSTSTALLANVSASVTLVSVRLWNRFSFRKATPTAIMVVNI